MEQEGRLWLWHEFQCTPECLVILCVHSDMGMQIWRLLFKSYAMLWNANKDCICTQVFSWLLGISVTAAPHDHLKHHNESSSWQIRGDVCPEWDTKCAVGDFCLVIPETWHCWSFHAPPLIAPDHFCLHLSRGKITFYSVHDSCRSLWLLKFPLLKFLLLLHINSASSRFCLI